MNDLLSYRRKLDKLLVQYDHARRQVQEERQVLAQTKEQVDNVLQAQKITQEVAQEIQSRVHAQISSVVSRCLKTVFGEEEAYEFKINFVKKRHKTETELVFVRDGREMDPLDASGGGVVDVAALALRLAALVLTRPAQRRLLVLDEPMKFLSANYRPKVRDLLMVLSKELFIQMIIVTHIEEFQVGKVIRLGEE